DWNTSANSVNDLGRIVDAKGGFAPLRTVNVTTTATLNTAIADALPGDDIVMAAGTYTNITITSTKDGTATNPIRLRGVKGTILTGGDLTTTYAIQPKADWWIFEDFEIANALAGIYAQGANDCIFRRLWVHNIGQEAIHLFNFSSRNLVEACSIASTGKRGTTFEEFGEAIYIGTDNGQWATKTGGLPDTSNDNIVRNCIIGPHITSEHFDIKEETYRTIVEGNTMFGIGQVATPTFIDAFIDIKGREVIVRHNRFMDADTQTRAIETNDQGIYDPQDCIFYGNEIRMTSGVGVVGIQINGTLASTHKVYRSNLVTGTSGGVSNVALVD
ncbi:MAG: right-handed parallel beta-helix repeat-containing protein, partial [Chloroflexota bacterium]|nr:right-handed parallel beta-helix repeat-containing protein [Chloroflexota bacterium]